MDCNFARASLAFAGKRGELATEDAAALDAHLASCASCAALAQSERAFDEHLHRAIQSVDVPAGLREQISVRLAAEQGRILRNKLLRYSAMAASVLLIAGLAFWWGSRRIHIDPHQMANQEDVRNAYVAVKTLEGAEEYFKIHGTPVLLPSDLDYNFESSLDVLVIDGQKVAQVEFQRGEFKARLLVFSRKHFQLAKNAERQAAASSCIVETSQNEDFIYVMIYFGESRRQHFQNQGNVVG